MLHLLLQMRRQKLLLRLLLVMHQLLWRLLLRLRLLPLPMMHLQPLLRLMWLRLYQPLMLHLLLH